MFQMLPSMTFGRRLSVWWSCMWRQMVANLPVWIAGVAVVGFWAWQTRSVSGHRLPSALLVEVGIAAVVVCFLVCVPITGYMVRKGFAVHELSAPDRLTVRQAVLVGLTTVGWSVLVSLPIDALTWPLRRDGHQLLGQAIRLVWYFAGGLYVVLPRQARRLRLLAGDSA
ncbi:hypothetical protein [Burkholderia mayonis]|uniref:Uncharacterized protein n=1 Tax=Burkholderia mayonis TaxID=1385591 RepID=A0A1B4G6G8_9BURK|nr:hypothetical protein [Burkholderia mayonis]AOJ11506.1 hypothetical protein WS71_31110 [Burkholderia mayonis]KVE46480.1 hypothetical protein WS71_22270 [Burkholderia mayonis]